MKELWFKLCKSITRLLLIKPLLPWLLPSVIQFFDMFLLKLIYFKARPLNLHSFTRLAIFKNLAFQRKGIDMQMTCGILQKFKFFNMLTLINIREYKYTHFITFNCQISQLVLFWLNTQALSNKISFWIDCMNLWIKDWLFPLWTSTLLQVFKSVKVKLAPDKVEKRRPQRAGTANNFPQHLRRPSSIQQLISYRNLSSDGLGPSPPGGRQYPR